MHGHVQKAAGEVQSWRPGLHQRPCCHLLEALATIRFVKEPLLPREHILRTCRQRFLSVIEVAHLEPPALLAPPYAAALERARFLVKL